jgi:hypothetical protein
MKTRLALCAALVSCGMNLWAGPASAGEFKGNWTITSSAQPGMVEFGLFHRHDGGQSQSENDWPVSAFQGLDLSTRARHDVKFTISRDAGRFDCEGFVNAGDGAGVFRFTPDPAFVQGMHDLGFGGIDDNKQFAMAVHDVTLEFARRMKNENLRGMDTDKLIAFRIFDITQRLMRDLRKEGITPDFIADMKSSGRNDPGVDQLASLETHGVD